MQTMNFRLRPVVAVDVDGVLRVAPPVGGTRTAAAKSSVRITVHRNAYPTYLHREPEWDSNDEWIARHWFSDAGVSWVRDLLSRDIDVVWATTWQRFANVYFAKALRLPELPVGVQEPGKVGDSSSTWKVWQLSRQFDGRPLLWVDDTPVTSRQMRLENLRRRSDRVLTHFHRICDPFVGITQRDVVEMDEWLELTRTLEGHAELRKRRRRDLARARAHYRRERWGTPQRYRAWQTVHDRLEAALGSGGPLPDLLADYAIDHPEGIDGAEVAAIFDEWGQTSDSAVMEVFLAPVFRSG